MCCNMRLLGFSISCRMEQEDPILDLAVDYVRNGFYPDNITKDKKRAVRKTALKLVVEQGEVFLLKKDKKDSQAVIIIMLINASVHY